MNTQKEIKNIDLIGELDQILFSSINDEKSNFELIKKLRNNTDEFLKKYITQRLELMDDIFSENREDNSKLVITNSKQIKTILTEIGEIQFKRNRYKNRVSNQSFYFIDNIFYLSPHQRIDLAYQKEIIKNSINNNYYEAARRTNNLISPQTAFNAVKRHYSALMDENNQKLNNAKEKNFIQHLQIEADEDHIHLKDKTNKQARIVYVHEGYQKQEDGRYVLKNPKYFISMHNQKNLWAEAKKYIEDNYIAGYTVSIHGDGAAWIKESKKYFPLSSFYLDKFHVLQAITRIMGGKREKKKMILDSIISGDRTYLDKLYLSRYGKEYKSERSINKMNGIIYLLNNFYNIEFKNHAVRCSAESHVSHVLSSRMSSRPMAWSFDGAERVSNLRGYKYNNGSYNGIYKNRPCLKLVEDIVNTTMITQEKTRRKNNTVLDKQGVSPIAKYTIDGWDGKQTEFSKRVKILFNNKLYT